MAGLLDGLKYDTPLAPEAEARFQAWRAGLPRNLQNTSDYDLRGAFLADAKEAATGHLPDTWKKPNHMTFSDESQYAGARTPGGHWAQAPDQSWTYAAPAGFQRFHTPDDLLNYFQAYEPGNRVVLPKGTR